MLYSTRRSLLIVLYAACFGYYSLHAQTSVKLSYNSSQYAGIEVGSKGVKLSIVDIAKNTKTNSAFTIIKDTSVNTDFISFTPSSSEATLNGLLGLYEVAMENYHIPSTNIYTVISSGVKVQAEKEEKNEFIQNLVTSFKEKINDDKRKVDIIDAKEEARLSHLGIVPDSKRFTTFLVDIGSGNTKGGFFPSNNISDFKLFQLTWGTKSVANAADKRMDESDKTLSNYAKQLQRVLSNAENSEIIYSVNSSGAYQLSDNIAFSGGIAWSVATLLHPELYDRPIVPVTFEEVKDFNDRLYSSFNSFMPDLLTRRLKDSDPQKPAATKEIKRVLQVFDQKSLMAGTGLMVKMMRQFASVYETKQFYLVKNGQVGWISAYVDQNIVPVK
ncbi:MAG: hypothetical protein JSS70_11870 [Bacteroidetes bacterium]|nr:hypothetical protein [Bacteroidota bacterium]